MDSKLYATKEKAIALHQNLDVTPCVCEVGLMCVKQSKKLTTFSRTSERISNATQSNCLSFKRPACGSSTKQPPAKIVEVW